jgi:predicted TPR repeat methyltransferase
MLAQASEKQVYDDLIKTELTAFLRDRHEQFDVIVSADTLVYFGPLDDVFAAAAAALRPSGLLILTLEEAFEDHAAGGYRLETHGRFSHTRAYVERAIAGAGLRPDIVQAELRLEAGTPVAGLVIRAVKPGSDVETARVAPSANDRRP